MSVNIRGGQSGADLEIESGHRAVRAALRPNDVGAGGAFSISMSSSVMNAGMAADSPVFTLRYTGAGVLLLRKCFLSLYASTTAFTAGIGNMKAYIARNYLASASGGVAVSLAPNNGKKRSSFGGSGVGDLRIATVTAITAGSRQLDASPFASVFVPVQAVANVSLIPPRTPLFEAMPGEWPIVLAGNEGIEITANVPATGTWLFGVDLDWEELSAFGPGLAA